MEELTFRSFLKASGQWEGGQDRCIVVNDCQLLDLFRSFFNHSGNEVIQIHVLEHHMHRGGNIYMGYQFKGMSIKLDNDMNPRCVSLSFGPHVLDFDQVMRVIVGDFIFVREKYLRKFEHRFTTVRFLDKKIWAKLKGPKPKARRKTNDR